MYVQALAFSSKSGKMISEYKLARSKLESVSFWWIGEREGERGVASRNCERTIIFNQLFGGSIILNRIAWSHMR